ncbi:hypothetical protein Pcinc_002570, partial [Petrolisthes cinctipes]
PLQKLFSLIMVHVRMKTRQITLTRSCLYCCRLVDPVCVSDASVTPCSQAKENNDYVDAPPCRESTNHKKTDRHSRRTFCDASLKYATLTDEETWSYLKEENGVPKWPELFPFCGGQRQSPVALVTDEAGGEFIYPWMPFNFKNYDTTPTKAEIKNEGGHTAKVEIEQDPVPTLVGGDLGHAYTFLQFHFHWGADDTRGSEHTVDGKVYPAELHLVHFRTDYETVANAVRFSDGLAVLGIFLEISDEDNPNLKSIIDGLPDITVHDTKTDIPPFPLRNLLPSDTTGFFRYLGSLTTPPCSEVVIWTVFKDVIKISRNQLAVFRTLFDKHGDPLVDNFRPTQPLFGREVLMNAEKPFWSYNNVFGDFGPEFWEDHFPMCGGQGQSPIALENPSQTLLPLNPFIFFNFDKTPKVMHLENNGHSAQVMFEMEDGVDIPSFTNGGLGTDQYIVAQFHFHWGSKISQGSEHTINGARFPAELHIVGFNSKYETIGNAIRFRDGLAVLGVMLNPSNTNNNNLNSIVTGLQGVVDAETEVEIEAFPLNQLLPFNLLSFYRYQGSLTTPGCSEVVTWTVFKDNIPVGDAQLEAFRKLVDDLWLPLVDNFRPLQERNGRDLILYGI